MSTTFSIPFSDAWVWIEIFAYLIVMRSIAVILALKWSLEMSSVATKQIHF